MPLKRFKESSEYFKGNGYKINIPIEKCTDYEYETLKWLKYRSRIMIKCRNNIVVKLIMKQDPYKVDVTEFLNAEFSLWLKDNCQGRYNVSENVMIIDNNLVIFEFERLDDIGLFKLCLI